MSWAEHFDTVAATYDEFTSSTGWHPNSALVEVLGRHEVEARSILDVGAGTGQTATALRTLYPDAELVLAEPSVEMARLAAAAHPGVALMVVGADELLGTVDPVLGRAAYDLITCIGVLELLPDPPATISRAAGNLAPGGHLAVTHEPRLDTGGVQSVATSRLSNGRAVTRVTSSELKAAAAGAGLECVDARHFVAYQRGDTHEDVIYEIVLWRVPDAPGAALREPDQPSVAEGE